MATRQKSFFDQQQNNKHYKRKPLSDWFNGSRTTKDADKSYDEPRPKTVMVPIPPSTSGRRKLSAFQFTEAVPELPPAPMHHPNKENDNLVTIARRANTDPETFKSTPQRIKPQTLAVDAASRLPPSTPATRLPLIDLLGNPEDTLPRPTYFQQTPEESVGWNYIPPTRFECHVDSPAAKRKRALSSSPVLSQESNSNLPPIVLKTPLADPAADLWDRYAIRSGVDNVEDPQAAFAHLIKDSSPRSSATAGSVGGLRRWASCGMEWPTSRSKRQRTRTGMNARPDDDQPLLEDGGSRPSKLSILIERMKETLPASRMVDRDMPASSSPMPQAHGVTDATSPLQRLGTADQAHDVDLEQPIEDEYVHDAPARHTESQASRRTSSDYGDLDEDTLDTVNASMAYFDAPQLIETEETVADNLAFKESAPIQQTIPSSLDAFDPAPLPVKDEFDSDEDFMAADMEQLMQRYDSQMVPQEEQAVTVSVDAQATGNITAPIELSDDEFGGDDDIDIDQLVAVEAALSQAAPRANINHNTSEVGKRAIQRYLVQIVDDGSYVEPDGTPQPEKILIVEDEKTKTNRFVNLRQSWWDTNCTVGSYIHIIGQFDEQGRCIIDDAHNMIILHPDHLISATTVADSFGCLRKAVLQDRVKSTSQAGPPLLYGTVLHELFQEAMKANKWDNDFLRNCVDTILPRHFDTIVEIGLNLNQVHEYLGGQFKTLQGWATLFVRAEPRDDAKIRNRGKPLVASINKLLDVEEHIWSPTYGLKGNIDATIQVTVIENDAQQTLTVPFELKTGKARSESHIAQTALYTLLLSDRYDLDVQYGLLYYLDGSDISRVQAIRREIIHMIMKRNELACYVRERISLPPPLPRSHLCRNCYTQTTCFLYHKLSEGGDGTQTAVKDTFKSLAGHLKAPEQEFFQKWDTLITKEEGEMMKFRRELWTMLSDERQKLGRCFADLALEASHADALETGSKINRYQYTFTKRQLSPAFSFAEASQITVGEAIVISDEEGHFALANGYVTAVSKRKIRVAVDRRLHNSRVRQAGFDPHDNQVFGGIMEVEGLPSIRRASQTADHPAISYRLDKDEFSNGMAAIRNNLLQIMDNNVFKAADLRALIIGNRTPRFRIVPDRTGTATQSWQAGMNSDQKAAVAKVMTAEDYALVLGMPGTGKTTTIAQIIEALVAQRKSVLLTSYTHTAVDNILLKFKDSNIEVLRHGNISKIHPEVQKFADLTAKPKDTIEELQESWHRPLVVATTCLGLNHPLFTQRTFDVCIVDEASQVTLPTCLGPIRMAKTFVLVGDHYQLPPLVQNKEAAEGGLDVSLFRLLSERQPQAVVSLEHQYRMCADIMMLANDLIYDGRLKCGNDAVANRMLDLPDPDIVKKYHQPAATSGNAPQLSALSRCLSHELPKCHLGKILNPDVKVLFLNTDTLGQQARESLQGNRITNTAEVILTSQLAYLFLAAGIAPSELGIMTFYRSQLALLRQAFRSPIVNTSQIELHTADKFQGRDKEAVIVSCVRNNDNSEIGELLKDWRRINVAITRARSKIILIGSKSTLSASEGVLQGLIGICERQGWIHDLDPHALEAHFFPEMVGSQLDTQLSPTKPAVPAITDALAGTSSQQPRSSPDRKDGSLLKGRGVPRRMDAASTVRRPLASTNGNRGPGSSNNPAFKMPLKSGKVNPETVMKRKPVLRDVLNDLL